MTQDGLPFDAPDDAPDFDGATYDQTLDHERLGAQALRVWTVVSDGVWRTLAEIEAICGDPQASVSARLRDFRKPKFGGHTLLRRRRGDGTRGWFEYCLVTGGGEANWPVTNDKAATRDVTAVSVGRNR